MAGFKEAGGGCYRNVKTRKNFSFLFFFAWNRYIGVIKITNEKQARRLLHIQRYKIVNLSPSRGINNPRLIQ